MFTLFFSFFLLTFSISIFDCFCDFQQFISLKSKIFTELFSATGMRWSKLDKVP